MKLTINGEPVDYALETERTLAEVARGVRAWLDQAGFMISAFRADGRDLLATPAEQWASLLVSEVGELAVEATHMGSLRMDHWRTMDTWLELLERDLAADRPGGSLAELLGSLDETLDGMKTNPFLPAGSADQARFDQLFRGQTAAQVSAWPPDRVSEVRGLIARMRQGLAARLADAAEPGQALSRCSAQLREQLARLSEVSVLLQTARDRDAMSVVIAFTDTAQALIELLPFLPPDPERGRLIVELTPFLRELVGAFDAKDSVLIGDLLEYEVTPRVQKLLPLLERAT